MIYFNIFILSLCLWASMYSYHKYINGALLNAKLFRLFALRDKLTILAMEGKINENSKEYQMLLYSINHYLNATKNFEILIFLKKFIEVENSPKIKKEMEEIKLSIEEHSVELKRILCEYFDILDSILTVQMRLFVGVFGFILSALDTLKISLDVVNKGIELFSKSLSLMKRVKENRDYFKSLNHCT